MQRASVRDSTPCRCRDAAATARHWATVACRRRRHTALNRLSDVVRPHALTSATARSLDSAVEQQSAARASSRSRTTVSRRARLASSVRLSDDAWAEYDCHLPHAHRWYPARHLAAMDASNTRAHRRVSTNRFQSAMGRRNNSQRRMTSARRLPKRFSRVARATPCHALNKTASMCSPWRSACSWRNVSACASFCAACACSFTVMTDLRRNSKSRVMARESRRSSVAMARNDGNSRNRAVMAWRLDRLSRSADDQSRHAMNALDANPNFIRLTMRADSCCTRRCFSMTSTHR